MRNRIFSINGLIVLLMCGLQMLSTGCSSQRSANKKNIEAEVPAEVALQTPGQRYSELCRTYGDWQDVALPVKVSLRAPKSISLSARAEMKRGSWIYMSVRMLGFEVASLWVDNDSVHAIDRYHKAYVSEGMNRVFGGRGVTINDVQDLLLGRGFVVGSEGGTFTRNMESAVKLTGSPEGLMVLPVVQPAGFEYGFMLPADANRIGAASVSVGEKYAATIAYGGFINTSHSGAFASEAEIEMVKGKRLAAGLEWNFRSAKWNTGLDRKWKRPSGYERMSADKILKALTKL